MDISSSPIGTTLQPPRKSIELEDPGAHDLGMNNAVQVVNCSFSCKALTRKLETSENEEDVFADAQEGPASSSGANSPIPTTRVEKVSFIIIVLNTTMS